MAERYQLQAGERGMPNAYAQANPVQNNIGAAVAGLGGQVGKLADIALRKKEELDMVRIEEATNEYAKWNLDYTNNPETGIFNLPEYKYGKAEGLTGKYEADSKAAAEKISGSLADPKQKAAFMRLALKGSMPTYKAVQDYESKQMEAFKGVVFEDGLEGDSRMVMSFPTDAETMMQAAGNVRDRFELHYIGMPPEAVAKMADEKISSIDKARIELIAGTDPMLAYEEAKNSKYLLPADAAELKKSVKGEAELIKAQETVDRLIGRYGVENETEVLKAIHASYEGERENRIVSLYRQRISEYAQAEERASKEAKKARDAAKSYLWDSYQSGNQPIPDAVLMELRRRKLINDDDVDDYREYNIKAGDFDRQKSFIRAVNPDWTEDQIERAAIDKLNGETGIADDKFQYFIRSIVTGEFSPEEARREKARGRLTDRMYDQLVEFEKTYAAEAKKFVTDSGRELNTALDELSGEYGMSPEARKKALDVFAGGIFSMSGEDRKDLRGSIDTLQVRALAAAAEEDKKTNPRDKKLYKAYEEQSQWVQTNTVDSFLFSEADAKAFEPVSYGDLASQANRAVWDASAKFIDVNYKYGGKSPLGVDGIDCSGLISQVEPMMMKDINKRFNREVFDKEAMNAVRGSAASIIKAVGDKTSIKTNPEEGYYRAGMLIGLGPRPGAAPKESGRFRDIGHIAMVIQTADNRLRVFEATSEGGKVRMIGLTEFLRKHAGRPIYVTNPLAMAENGPATPSASRPLRPLMTEEEIEEIMSGGN